MKKSESSASAAAGRRKKNSGTAGKTTAANLEARFDRGERVLDYFDPQGARVTHGGRRAGAGRKPTGNVRMQIYVSEKVRGIIARKAEKEGKSLSAVIEEKFT